MKRSLLKARSLCSIKLHRLAEQDELLYSRQTDRQGQKETVRDRHRQTKTETL